MRKATQKKKPNHEIVQQKNHKWVSFTNFSFAAFVDFSKTRWIRVKRRIMNDAIEKVQTRKIRNRNVRVSYIKNNTTRLAHCSKLCMQFNVRSTPQPDRISKSKQTHQRSTRRSSESNWKQILTVDCYGDWWEKRTIFLFLEKINALAAPSLLWGVVSDSRRSVDYDWKMLFIIIHHYQKFESSKKKLINFLFFSLSFISKEMRT